MPVKFSVLDVLSMGEDIAMPFFLRCAENDDWEAVEELMLSFSQAEVEASVKASDMSGFSAIIDMVWECAPEDFVLKMVDECPSLMSKTLEEGAALHFVIKRNSLPLLDKVFSSGMDVSGLNNTMSKAAQFGSPEIIKMLAERMKPDDLHWDVPPVLIALLEDRDVEVFDALISLDISEWWANEGKCPWVSESVAVPSKMDYITKLKFIGGSHQKSKLFCQTNPYVISFAFGKMDCLQSLVSKFGAEGLTACTNASYGMTPLVYDMRQTPLGLWTETKVDAKSVFERLMEMGGGLERLEGFFLMGKTLEHSVNFLKESSNHSVMENYASASDFKKPGSFLATLLLHKAITDATPSQEVMDVLLENGARPEFILKAPLGDAVKSLLESVILKNKESVRSVRNEPKVSRQGL